MEKDLFAQEALIESHSKWKQGITRKDTLYERENDIRSPFARDFNRVLHCAAYRRLKHKTQVFFAVQNDHICTRMEHVHIVASVSHTIAKHLGLNTELVRAMALGHDLGHAPFGHAGENFLKEIAKINLGEEFWHEKNSLRFVDSIETLEDTEEIERNLNLTYAVRDGIISHCGEVDENGLKPRIEAIPLNDISEPNQYPPFSWEGCVVKISDKIAYLGRDIEDALSLNILDKNQKNKLLEIADCPEETPLKHINNTILMHNLIIDLCKNSSPKHGLRFSSSQYTLINTVKEFNYENIYRHPRLTTYMDYAKLIINTIFKLLLSFYDGDNTIEELQKHARDYPEIVSSFKSWLVKYSNYRLCLDYPKYKNKILYNLGDRKNYIQAIIDFLAGMTDAFAIKLFQETVTFR